MLDFEKLKELNLFKNLELENIKEYFKNIRFSIKRYKKDEIVVIRGEFCGGLYILLEGVLNAEFVGKEGKVVEIEKLYAPTLLAPGFIFSSSPYFPVDLHVIEDAKIIYIPKNEFINLLLSNKLILENFLRIISDKLSFITNKMYDISMKKLLAKIANFILELSEYQSSSKVILPFTKEELSRRFGVTRPALSRAFSILVKKSIIHQNGKEINIINKDELKRIADEYSW